MAIIRRKKNTDDNINNNIFWTTMSDLMLGLAIIFIAMFVLAMTGFTQNRIHKQQEKIEISTNIEKKLNAAHIDASVNKASGVISIPSAALFEINSYVLTKQGKDLLDKFAPIYINTIFENNELSQNIENIAIQGYTDSQTFAGINSVDKQFLQNMDLSLKRAHAVTQYLLLNTNYNKKYAKNFRDKIIVEGNSFNNPIIINGKEDYNKSRRVELKLIVKDSDISSMLGF